MLEGVVAGHRLGEIDVEAEQVRRHLAGLRVDGRHPGRRRPPVDDSDAGEQEDRAEQVEVGQADEAEARRDADGGVGAGVAIETVDAWKGAKKSAILDGTSAVVVRDGGDGTLSLQTLPLP